MKPSVVRRVRNGDIARVWEMVHELAAFEDMTDILTGTRDKLHAMLFDERPVLFGHVAEAGDGRLVGYTLYHFTYSSFRTNHRMWLEDLYVEKEARGMGAGEALLKSFVADALERGCHRVDWHVLEMNPARQFYEAHGAQRSDDGMLQYGLDMAGMRKLLGL